MAAPQAARNDQPQSPIPILGAAPEAQPAQSHGARTRTITARLQPRAPQELLGTAQATEELRRFILIAARADRWSVLLNGESGTGKGLAASLIHAQSGRRAKPFVEVNCAAIPEQMAEAELFGYRRGAFTGADRDHTGYLEQANGGTIHLDEIGAMSFSAQAKLLRAIEDKRIRRLGTTADIPLDIRIIGSTSAKLPEMMKEGAFRPDLFYRLSKLRFTVAPLRNRKEDIPALVIYFAQKAAGELGAGSIALEAEAFGELQNNTWTGNIRELDNCVSDLVAYAHFNKKERITRNCVRKHFHSDAVKAQADVPGSPQEYIQAPRGERLGETLARVEYAIITQTLKELNQNRAATAKRLGIDRGHLTKRLAGLEAQIGSRPVAIQVSLNI